MADRSHDDSAEKGMRNVNGALEHREERRDSVAETTFNRRHASIAGAGSRRASIRKSFDNSNLSMVGAHVTHYEMAEDGGRWRKLYR